MSNFYEFYCPVKIIAGLQALDHIPFELTQLGSKRPMLITDKGVKSVGLLKPIQDSLASAEAHLACEFANVPPDSSLVTVRDAAKAYRDNHCDALIAVGGGSVIDTAKAVNVLVSEGGDNLKQYSGAHKLSRPLKPFIMIPTTAGTGSEVTSVAVISDTETNTKLAFSSYYLLPDAAVLDPRMTQTLPAHLTAMTAMDAMTHAIEAYTCLAHNPISDAYATAAISKIRENLLPILDNPSNAQKRLELAQASTMAGIAFSNSMVGLVHSLGHATGAVCHLPHGLCMNLYLPYVLTYNKDTNGDRIAELLLAIAGNDIYSQTPANERADKVIDTILTLRDTLYEKTKLPRTLKETGKVTQADFDAIADKALDDGSIIYNPKESSKQDLLAILQLAWDK